MGISKDLAAFKAGLKSAASKARKSGGSAQKGITKIRGLLRRSPAIVADVMTGIMAFGPMVGHAYWHLTNGLPAGALGMLDAISTEYGYNLTTGELDLMHMGKRMLVPLVPQGVKKVGQFAGLMR